jgi:hypothetical protein
VGRINEFSQCFELVIQGMKDPWLSGRRIYRHASSRSGYGRLLAREHPRSDYQIKKPDEWNPMQLRGIEPSMPMKSTLILDGKAHRPIAYGGSSPPVRRQTRIEPAGFEAALLTAGSLDQDLGDRPTAALTTVGS